MVTEKYRQRDMYEESREKERYRKINIKKMYRGKEWYRKKERCKKIWRETKRGDLI